MQQPTTQTGSQLQPPVPGDVLSRVPVLSPDRQVRVAFSLDGRLKVSQNAINHLRSTYPLTNFPSDPDEYRKNEWRTNPIFTREIKFRKGKHLFTGLGTRDIPEEYVENLDCWRVELHNKLCLNHFSKQANNYYIHEKAVFNNETMELLKRIDRITSFPERFTSFLSQEEASSWLIKETPNFLKTEIKSHDQIKSLRCPPNSNKPVHHIPPPSTKKEENTEGKENSLKIVLSYKRDFIIKASEIKTLKERYPEENFPDDPDEYNKIKWRINTKFSGEVNDIMCSKISAMDFNYPFKALYSAPVSKLATQYPDAIQILPFQHSQYSDPPEDREFIFTDNKKLEIKKRLETEKKHLIEIQNEINGIIKDKKQNKDQIIAILKHTFLKENSLCAPDQATPTNSKTSKKHTSLSEYSSLLKKKQSCTPESTIPNVTAQGNLAYFTETSLQVSKTNNEPPEAEVMPVKYEQSPPNKKNKPETEVNPSNTPWNTFAKKIRQAARWLKPNPVAASPNHKTPLLPKVKESRKYEDTYYHLNP